MDTTISSYSKASENTAIIDNTKRSAYARFIEKLEFSYFGLISMTILIGSIIGGIAAMYVFQNHAPIWQFALCVSFGMANNVSAIAQAPTKWVVNIFIANLIVNVFLIVINVF